MVTKERSVRGKKNRNSGADFERRVRKDLEESGFMVSKWMNNIKEGKLVAAKQKFRGRGIPMAIGTGFPDFIAYKEKPLSNLTTYEVFGVEAKSNGYLDKEERKKCEWLLKNRVFSGILIAYKEKEGRRIVVRYKDYEGNSNSA